MLTRRHKLLAGQILWIALRWLLIRQVRKRTRGTVARMRARRAVAGSRWRGRRGLAAAVGLGALIALVGSFAARRRF